jgi:hypothetical protein
MQFSEIKTQFNRGHLGLIAIAVIVLGGLTFAQSQNVFSKFSQPGTEEGGGLYYAYQSEPVPNVLGDDTIPDGPSVINEDGTISTLNDFGEVLGSASDTPDINLDSIAVKISSQSWTAKDYFDATFLIESSLKPGDFEAALISTDPAQSTSQIRLIKDVQARLQQMEVPDFAAKLHKLKIAQYMTAADLLSNYYQADSNPEYVSGKLTQFMDMQKLHEQEAQNLLNSEQL